MIQSFQFWVRRVNTVTCFFVHQHKEPRLLCTHQRKKVIWKGHQSPDWTFHTTGIIIYLWALVSPSQRCCQPVSQALSEDVSLDHWHIWATFSPALSRGDSHTITFSVLLLHILPAIPTTNFTRKWNVKPSAEGDFHLSNAGIDCVRKCVLGVPCYQ